MSTRRTSKQPELPDETRSINAVVAIVLETLPLGKRDIQTICKTVKRIATAAEWLKWGEQSLVNGVRTALRTRDAEGNPKAVSLNGEYREPEQLEFPDFVKWAYEMARRGREMFHRTREIAALCAEQTGRTFDPDDVIKAASDGESVESVLKRISAA
jgi:hypothetical protein